MPLTSNRPLDRIPDELVRQLIISGQVWAGIVIIAGSLISNVTDALAAGEARAFMDRMPITARHTGITREIAAGQPRGEDDQAVVDGWPMYRTERGQEAFNHAMATLRATEGPNPPADAFQGCERLGCSIAFPKLSARGWIPAGRLWVSPSDYILVVHSPRRSKSDPGRRRSRRSMRYFVFHEFHNSTGNTDLFDTISAHRRSVFVPFYLGKQGRDAKGRNYVIVVQVSPHDIVSRHARVFGSAGPGIEVAKNSNERLTRLQAEAGIMVASIVKAAVPGLRMVNHRGSEGRPMLRAYQQRLSSLRRLGRAAEFRLPFVAASSARVARAAGSLRDIIVHRGPIRTMPPVVDQPALAIAGIPRLVSAPRLVQMVRRPILTMDKLLSQIMSERFIAPPKPRPACRSAPAYEC